VMLLCTTCNRPVRVRHEYHGDRHVRVCSKCANTLEK